MPALPAAPAGARRRDGAAVLVVPGVRLSDVGSVVGGVPAKVLRPATDDDRAHIEGNAASYVDRLPTARRVRPVVRTKLPPAGLVPGDDGP